jgi:RNA polymerase sigma-70 factor, ECF subfamily
LRRDIAGLGGPERGVSLSATRYLPSTLGRAAPIAEVQGNTEGREEPPAELATQTRSVAETSSPNESDELLLVLVCDGDKEALARLFRRYARVVRAVSYRVLRDTSEADDLVQDIFLLVHRTCKTFDSSKGPARSWILQMAYRRAISRRRYLTSRHFYTCLDLDDPATDLSDPRTGAGSFENSIDGRLGNGGIQKVFEALSENQRQTLQLHFMEGYTLDEIAAKLGQTRGNVKHHYFRGLERLRKELFGGKLPGGRAV